MSCRWTTFMALRETYECPDKVEAFGHVMTACTRYASNFCGDLLKRVVVEHLHMRLFAQGSDDW